MCFARVNTARAALLTSGRAVLRHARTPAADNNKGLNNSFCTRLRADKTYERNSTLQETRSFDDER